MPEYLFIRLAEPTSSCASVVLNAEGRIVSPVNKGPLATIAQAVQNRRVIALLPGPEVVTTQATVPAASQSRMRQMLPYSLEETFAEDVEKLLFAAGKRWGSGATAVSVIARDRLDYWLAQLELADITAQAVYSDADGVADTPSTLNLILEGDRIYCRRPEQPALVFEGLSLAQVFELLETQSEHRADLQHALIYVDEAVKERYQPQIEELQSRLSSIDVKTLGDGALAHIAATLVFQPGTNLLQGPYAPKSNWRELARPWYVAASLLLAVLLLTIVGQAAEYLMLKREDGILTEVLTTSCERSFSSARISTCTAEVRQRLNAAGQETTSGGETFLTTLAAIAESHGEDNLIDTISYRNRVMNLQVIAPDVPKLDQFKQQIEGTERFDVVIDSTSDSDAGVEGRVRIVGADR